MSAPAGTGKTTLARMLCDQSDGQIVESISCTTRSIRPGETEGKDYYFISKKEFIEKRTQNAFLESADVFGHSYGTLKKTVLDEQNKGHHVILVIDTQGALQLKGAVEAVFIFIAPPSMEELERRLRNRKTETAEVIEERLSWAKKEMDMAKQYDYRIVNDDLDIAFQELKNVVIAEEKKSKLREN